MKQVIILARCSTERQEIESQIAETKRYALSLGYKEEQFVVIAKCGASAVKLNPLYQQTIDELYKTIIEKDVEAVVVYHLNRLARNGVVAMQIKEFLVEHKTQLHVKEPSIKLLQNDGSVDSGASLCFALFAEMSQQQASELKAKTIRAKKRDKQLGLFIGGKIPCGYDVIERRYVLNEEADIIKMVYNMYSTGQYSFATLAEELKKQGIEKDEYWVCQRLKYQAYWDGSLPQIIPIEIAEKCCKIREQNKTNMPRTIKHHYFANRILKCPKCGYGYTSSARTYICCECKHGDRISIKWLDGLLWLVASHLEGEARLNDTDHEKAVKEKEAVLERKIKAVDNYKAKAEKRQQRAKEAYLNGVIDLTEYKAKTQADESMIKDLENEKISYTNELELLRQPAKTSFDRVLKIADEIEESDEQEMRSIVRKWVKSVVIDDGIVCVETLVRNYKCKYLPKSWNGRFFTTGGRRLVVHSIERSVDGAKLGKAVGDVNDVVITTAWLSGSMIV